MVGVLEKTEKVLHLISGLPCLNNYTLVGGTGIAVQIGHRLSEDLDFCTFKQRISEKAKVDFATIKKELEAAGKIEKMLLLENDQVDLLFNGVKLTFFANDFTFRELRRIPIENNIFVAELPTAGAMKVYVLPYRSKFRDYYDIYSLLQHGVSIRDMVDGAARLNKFQISTKSYLSMLTDGKRYEIDPNFASLNPKYSVSAKEIEEAVATAITVAYAAKVTSSATLEMLTKQQQQPAQVQKFQRTATLDNEFS